jgi:hypothetical protein
MPLLQKDIRKLQPSLPQTVRRRESSSPFVTSDSKTSSSQEARPSSATIPSTRSISRVPNFHKSANEGSSAPSSPIVYWSEFETPEQEPYTVPVDESTALLPWLQRRRKPERDLERGTHYVEDDSFFKRTLEKIRGVVEFEVKTSADGLSTLFYEKDYRRGEVASDEDESYNSEDSSYSHVIQPESSHRHQGVGQEVGGQSGINETNPISRIQLLNRGYILCVVGCTMLSSAFGIIGLLLSGHATGIAFVLVGFLISMTLEMVSLVRFIMYRHPLFTSLIDVGKVDILELPGLGF